MQQQQSTNYLLPAFLLLLLACTFAIAVPAIAFGAAPTKDSKVALGVSPALTELILKPGTTTKTEITLSNLTDEPVPVKGSVTNLEPTEHIEPKDRPTFDASAWFKLSEETFILYPKQQKKITVTVATPAQAEPGGHYATIFFQPAVAASSLKPDTTYIGTKVGVQTFLVVQGKLNERLLASEPRASFINEKGPVQLTFTLTNTGNVHILPTTHLEIYNFRARRIASIPFTPAIILPHTTRTFTTTWDNKGQLGRFMAKLDVSYGTQRQRQTSMYHSFWVAPFFRFGMFILIVGGVSLVAWKTKGRWRRAISALVKQQ